MKTKQYRTIIGRLGDKKLVCITDKDGTIISKDDPQ